MSQSGSRSRQLQSLLNQLAAGDDGAIPALIDRSCERLRKLTRKMLKTSPRIRSEIDTDDLLQDSVIRLCRALEAVKPPTVRAFIGLATKQIQRQLIDIVRRLHGPEGELKNRAVAIPSGKSRQRVIRDKPDSSAGPSTLAEWTEFHEKVEQLPDEEREVFDLVYYQGLSQAEVAELLGVVERTIKRRWRSARLLLHSLLKGHKPGK